MRRRLIRLRWIAAAYLGIAALTAGIGTAAIVYAFVAPSAGFTLPGVVLETDAIRDAALALGALIVAVGALNAVVALRLLGGSRSAWAPAVASAAVTAGVLTMTLMGLLFQRGVGPLPGADLMVPVVGASAALYVGVCGALLVGGPPDSS